jgi:type IV secretion system protein VirD4
VYLINPFPSKARNENGKIRIDPATGKEMWELRTHQYNPFFYVPEDFGLCINQLQKIGSFLFPDPPDGKDAFWSSSARSLFLGLSLYVLESAIPHTIGEVLRQAQFGGDSGDSISAYWAKIIKDREGAGKPLSQVCVQCLMDFISTGGNTLTSIRKSVTTGLEAWQNPTVDAMTSGNSFDLRDLRKKKMTIYLGVSPDNLVRAKGLLSLFLQQAMDLNMQEMPQDNDRIKHPVALLLDEITALGRMEILAKAIGYFNGYWIMPYFIIQAFSQLRSV